MQSMGCVPVKMLQIWVASHVKLLHRILPQLFNTFGLWFSGDFFLYIPADQSMTLQRKSAAAIHQLINSAGMKLSPEHDVEGKGGAGA